MPLDPQVRALLDQMAGLPRLEELSVADPRKQVEGRIELANPTGRFRVESYYRGTGWRFAAAHLHAQWERAFPFDGVLSRQRFCALQSRHARRRLSQSV